MTALANGGPNIERSNKTSRTAPPKFETGIDSLSHYPVMNVPGYYVGGISEQSLGVLRPIHDFFSKREEGQSVDDYIRNNPEAAHKAIYAGLPEPLPEAARQTVVRSRGIKSALAWIAFHR